MAAPRLFGLLLLLTPVAASAADDPVYTRLVEDGKKQRRSDLSLAEGRLRVAKLQLDAVKAAKPTKGTMSPSFSGPKEKPVFTYYWPKDKEATLKQVQERISELEARVANLQKAEWVPLRLDPINLDVGQVGVITAAFDKPVQYEAFQVIDADTVIVRFSNRLHWLKIPTKNMIDGRVYSLDQIVHVKGTRTYQTTSGTRTVLELETYTPPAK